MAPHPLMLRPLDWRQSAARPAAPSLVMAPVLIALRIFFLRFRLLAVRGLLRWVIALRSFIRRPRERILASMRPADIRVDLWEWIPTGQRKGRLLLPVLIVAAACAATGFAFMKAWQHERNDPAAPSHTAVVSHEHAEAVKPRSTVGEEVDLVFKGEYSNAHTEATSAKPASPAVVVLNPGTADQRANSRTQASVQVRTPPLSPKDNDVSRRDVTNKKGQQ